MLVLILFSALLLAGVCPQTEFDGGLAITTTEYTNVTSENKTTVRLPKCCPQGLAVGAGSCNQSTVLFQPNFKVYNHNETAFDDVPMDPALIAIDTYVNDPCQVHKFPVAPDENAFILRNGSLLLGGLLEYDGILGHDRFCIDNLNVMPDDETVYMFVCVKEQEVDLPKWAFSIYIFFTSCSAILLASSAIFFYLQDIQGPHKKSYIAYASSMSLTYFIIVLVQYLSWSCNLFGLLLQFFVTLSYCWLAVLCFDLAYSIYFLSSKEPSDHTNTYIKTTTAFAAIFLLISICNNFTPDIPFSFFKPQFGRTDCVKFENQRTSLFFVPIGISISISVLSLCYSLIRMNQNRYHSGSEEIHQWKKVSKKYSYMYGRKLLVFLTMIIWIFDAFSDSFPQNSSISIIILCLQACHGFIIVPLYTMTPLRRVINVNNKPRIENLDELLEVDTSRGNHSNVRMI